MVRAVLLVVVLALGAGEAAAQVAEGGGPAAAPNDNGRGETIAKFLAGGALGLVAHEGAHLAFDVIFDADPHLERVDFHGIPFFAIAHRPDLPRRQQFVIASAGFWAQHAGSEWLLTRRPGIRHECAPVAKGVLAFNIVTSMAYAGAAFARTGPPERDTRGMALASRTDERVIGALVLAPAVLDAWRYFEPDRAWLKWTSRAVKAGMVLLVIR